MCNTLFRTGSCSAAETRWDRGLGTLRRPGGGRAELWPWEVGRGGLLALWLTVGEAGPSLGSESLRTPALGACGGKLGLQHGPFHVPGAFQAAACPLSPRMHMKSILGWTPRKGCHLHLGLQSKGTSPALWLTQSWRLAALAPPQSTPASFSSPETSSCAGGAGAGQVVCAGAGCGGCGQEGPFCSGPQGHLARELACPPA